MTSMRVDDGEIRRLEKVLEGLSKKGIPFAIKAALNAAVYDASGRARNEMRKNFILRNNYTVRSLVYEQVPKAERNPNKMKASVGSVMRYMRDQEVGATHRGKSKHGLEIPTGEAAGTPNARPRLKTISQARRYKSIKIVKPTVRGGLWASKEQEIVRTAQEAVNKGPRYTVQTIGDILGLWKIVGGRKGVKRGYPKGVRFRLMYSMGHRSVKVKSKRWLSAAAAQAANQIPNKYIYELNKQIDFLIKRHGLDRMGDRETRIAGPARGEQMELFK